MPVLAVVNVSLEDQEASKTVAAKIRKLKKVQRVLVLSKKPVIYVAEGYSRARFQEPNPIHLIVYVSARTCLEALSTVLQIRNASDGIKGTVTSLGFPAKPA